MQGIKDVVRKICERGRSMIRKIFNRIKGSKVYRGIRGFCGRLLVKVHPNKILYADAELTDRYKDLAPSDTLENVSEYFDALDWAFSNFKVRNIAIAGPYGSGKSSIISTYVKKHPELKAINISLANFVGCGKEDEEGLVDFEEEDIEKGILKQLFYKVKYRKIPQSRYRKIRIISKKKIFGALCGILALVYVILSFFITDIADKVKSIITIAELNWGIPNKVIYMLAIGVVLLCVYILTRGIWFMLSRVHIKELNVADKASAQLGEQEESSIFNRNMDEIIYFFEKTKYNVVFIEDLDRFKTPKIFVKLRELNTILNNYESIKKRIVFVYAIRDNMFSNSDRTKFFDYMLPVIPVINETNSGEILSKRIAEDNKKHNDIQLGEEYVEMISSFISDMRVLNNIYNEFITYKKMLQSKDKNEETKLTGLKDELMFSLMVFKNLYPKDFAELQAETGIVKEAFDTQKALISKRRNEFEQQRKQLVNQLETLEQEVLKSVSEVKSAMLDFMMKGKGGFRYITIGGKSITYGEIMKDSFDVEKLRAQGSLVSWASSIATSFDGRTEFVGKNDYITRCKKLQALSPEKREEYAERIEHLGEQIRGLGALTMQELFAVEYGIESELPDTVKKNKLLMFMLRYGFINEEYADYMNYFHANSITKGDKDFILAVRNREALEFDYPLSKVEQVIKKLQVHEFEQREIYNIDLMDALLSKPTEAVEKRKLLFHQLADESEISWSFVETCADKARQPECFFAELVKAWPGMWNYVCEDNSLTKERKDKYFVYMCQYGSLEDIVAQDRQGKIKAYFEENEDILKILYDVPEDRVIDIMNECDVYYTSLLPGTGKQKVLDWIFDNGCYDISPKMLQCIFRHKAPEKEAELLTRNYTTILDLGYQPLLDKLNKDFEKYVQDIVLELKTNTQESITAVLFMLEKGISLESARKLIQKEEVELELLTNCEFDSLKQGTELKDVWDVWIANNKLHGSWANVIRYWEHCGVTEELQVYIENTIDTIVEKTCPEDMDPALVKEIIESDLEISSFEKFIEKECVKELDLDISAINSAHMEVLVKMDYFVFTEEYAKELKEYHSKWYVKTILEHIMMVLENPEAYPLDCQEMEVIVESDLLTDKDKLHLLEVNNLDKFSEKLATYLCGVTDKISIDSFRKAWKVLNVKSRYKLFVRQIDILDCDEVSECFAGLGPGYEKFVDRTRRLEGKLVRTQENERIAAHLKKIGYITSYWYVSNIPKPLFGKGAEAYIMCKVKKVN